MELSTEDVQEIMYKAKDWWDQNMAGTQGHKSWDEMNIAGRQTAINAYVRRHSNLSYMPETFQYALEADEAQVWRCNLCNMELKETSDIEQRKQRHEDFHKDESVGKAGARQRNWTFGQVNWTLEKPSTMTSMYEYFAKELGQ